MSIFEIAILYVLMFGFILMYRVQLGAMRQCIYHHKVVLSSLVWPLWLVYCFYRMVVNYIAVIIGFFKGELPGVDYQNSVRK